jgi:predicted metal-dependent hydrolase
MRAAILSQIELAGRRIEYRIVASRSARKLRVRVGLNGVEVVQPPNRTSADVIAFLEESGEWIADQLRRTERLRIRAPDRRTAEILYRGELTPICIEETATRRRGGYVTLEGGTIVIRRNSRSSVPASRSLENWLRRQARAAVEQYLPVVAARLRQGPHKVYIMGQRTKWGNCSSQRNLSFNWRLIMAPDTVLRYLITHEAVHLAIPDHSARFWLTVQSMCRETERAKQWLSANSRRLSVDLDRVCRDVAITS